MNQRLCAGCGLECVVVGDATSPDVAAIGPVAARACPACRRLFCAACAEWVGALCRICAETAVLNARHECGTCGERFFGHRGRVACLGCGRLMCAACARRDERVCPACQDLAVQPDAPEAERARCLFP